MEFRSLVIPLFLVLIAFAQNQSTKPVRATVEHMQAIPLREISRTELTSESGGAFMNGAQCDQEGNLYLRKVATDRPLLSPVVKINAEGKREASFNPAVFPDIGLSEALAYSPSASGGLFQLGQTAGVKPQIYVLRYSSDGSPATPTRLEDSFEARTFVAFSGENFLVSGTLRETSNPSDKGRAVTAVFSSDGRKLAELRFDKKGSQKTETTPVAPNLDLSAAEAGADGNVYALRRSSAALVYVIGAAGNVVRTIKVNPPTPGAMPNSFHVSGNQIAVSFTGGDGEYSQKFVVADSQSGQVLRTFSQQGTTGSEFACYSANDGEFTFVHLGENNKIELVHAQGQ
jgi:hypothetical protein